MFNDLLQDLHEYRVCSWNEISLWQSLEIIQLIKIDINHSYWWDSLFKIMNVSDETRNSHKTYMYSMLTRAASQNFGGRVTFPSTLLLFNGGRGGRTHIQHLVWLLVFKLDFTALMSGNLLNLFHLGHLNFRSTSTYFNSCDAKISFFVCLYSCKIMWGVTVG